TRPGQRRTVVDRQRKFRRTVDLAHLGVDVEIPFAESPDPHGAPILAGVESHSPILRTTRDFDRNHGSGRLHPRFRYANIPSFHEPAVSRGGVLMKLLRIGLFVLSGLMFVPVLALARATSSIAGVVRDTSGGVMPGVTVEASSPALIEKTRTAVTDADGQYKLINLSPGTYTVTFSLEGFSTVKREGVQLTGDFTATINAE